MSLFMERTMTALKMHPQIPLILDTLTRLHQHHLLITSDQGDLVHTGISDSLVFYFSKGKTSPPYFPPAIFHYPDARNPVIFAKKSILAENTTASAETSAAKNATLEIIIVSDASALLAPDTSEMLALLREKINSPHTRLIFFAGIDYQKKDLPFSASLFSVLKLAPVTNRQIIALLKEHRESLEKFHKVILSGEIFSAALSFALRLRNNMPLAEKAFSLIDTSAARARAEHDPHSPHQPVVTLSMLARIVAEWTEMPVAHFNHNHFAATRIAAALRKQIYGQEEAIREISVLLQNAFLFPPATGPLAILLLAGPEGTGKTTCARALAACLYNEKSLVRATCEKILEAQPGTVILLEDIEQTDTARIAPLLNKNLSHTILLMTTTIGADLIKMQTSTHLATQNEKPVSLLQLVMETHMAESASRTSVLLADTLRHALYPLLAEQLPRWLLRRTSLVPFIPLDHAAAEKLAMDKISRLATLIETYTGLEPLIMPEVNKFIVHHTSGRHNAANSFGSGQAEFHLQSVVAQQLFMLSEKELAEKKSASKRLRLRLDEEGEMLVCDFIGQEEDLSKMV
jgi:AAA lid domain-containing protein/ATPase family protein associated with various cellular activities (AAA)